MSAQSQVVPSPFDFSMPVFHERVDPALAFDWGTKGPLTGDDLDYWLARWTGYVTVPLAGAYCFGTWADDGTRVWINNQLVLDNWVDQGATDRSCTGGSVSFSAGETKSIRVEYYERTAGAAAVLKVFGGPTGTMDVPAGWLSTELPVLGPGWTFADGDVSVTGARMSGASVTLTMGDGSTVEYRRGDGGAFVGPPGDGTVVRVDGPSGEISVTDDAGVSYRYSADGLLLAARSAVDDRSPAATQYEWTGTPARLRELVDPVSGQRTTLRYGGDPQCAAPPAGHTIAAGLLCRVEGLDGRATDLFYAQGRLERVVQPGGNRVEYTYDAANRLTSVTDATANAATDAGVRADDASVTWQIGYDTQGRATTVTAPAATTGAARQATTMLYDSAAVGLTLGSSRVQVGGLAQPHGFTRKVTFDSFLRQRASWDDANDRSEVVYDGASDRVAYSDVDVGTAQQLRTSTVYDTSVVFNGLSRPRFSYGPAPAASFTGASPNAGAQVPTTETRYDEGITGLQVAWWNDPPQNGEVYSYPNRPAFRGAPVLHGVTTSADTWWNWGAGSPDPQVGADNFSGRMTGLVNMPVAGGYSFEAWANDGVRVTVDDRVVIDGWNTPLQAVTGPVVNYAAGWHRITIEFKENAGTAAFSVNWLTPGATTRVYIPASNLKPDLGLVTTSIDAAGTTTTTGYTDPARGLATSTTVDPGGLALTTATTYEPRAAGNFARRTSRSLPAVAGTPNSTSTYTHYGPTEVAPSVACPAGSGMAVASVNQRGLPRTARSADPNTLGGTGGVTVEQVHDASGRQVATRYVGEATWSCTAYDGRGRVTAQAVPAFGGQPARTVTTTYSVGGDPLLTKVEDPAGAITTRVDLLGRVTDTVDVWGIHTHTDYDAAGRVSQATVFRSTGAVLERVMFDYAATGAGVNQLAAQRFSAAAATVSGYNFSTLTASTAMPTVAGATLASLSYDAVGRVASVAYAPGVSSTVGYDASGRTASLAHAKAGATITSDVVTRDLGGRIIDRSVDGVDANPTGSNYGYDAAGRLTSWSERDPGAGVNVTGTYGYTYPGGTVPAGCSGGWGNAGSAAGRSSNRLSATVQVGAGAVASTSYCYDHADRIQRVLPPSGTSTPYGGFVYDSHGNATRVGVEERVYDGANRHVGTRSGVTPTALLVVGDPAVLNNRDTWMRQRLLDAGWSVVVADDNAVTAADAGGKALVVVSESVAQAAVSTKLDAVAVPVVVAESFLFDEMRMTSTGAANQGTVATQTQLSVTAAGGGHTLGAGFPQGNLTTSSAAITHGYGVPTASATIAATVAGDPAKPAIFGYEAGAALVAGVAPARRVGFYLYGGSTTTLTKPAVELFDAAVAWAAGTTPSIAYTRDATDRIVERRVNTRVEARYSYTGTGDTSDLTLDGSNNLVEATLALPGGALYTWRAAGEVWSWPNLNGHVTAVTDATGTKLGPTRNYDPFGQPLTASGVPIDNSAGEMDYSWHGQQQRPLEHQSGAIPTIEMGARQYDPALGRFLEVDPIDGGGANDYLYPFDPINMSDLDGLCWGPARRWRGCGVARTSIRKQYQLSRFLRNGLNGTTQVGVWWGLAGRGSCRMNGQEIMIVCSGMRRLSVRGGTAVGSTFVTRRRQREAFATRLMAHEAKHADQWTLFGPSFAAGYGAAHARQGECNLFERWAGFRDGGYEHCR